MKKMMWFFVVLLSIFFGNTHVFAKNTLDTELKRSVIFEFIADDILVWLPESYQYIQLRYADVKPNQKIYPYLQKVVYTGALPNNTKNISPQSFLKAYNFYDILEKITWFDFVQEGNQELLKKRNTQVQDILFVREILTTSQNIDISLQNTPSFSFLSPEDQDTMRIYIDVYQTLMQDYLKNDTLLSKDLLYGSIEWLTNGTGDKHTVFFPPVESQQFSESLAGEFEWIGAYVEMWKPWVLTIVSPIAWSPAEKYWLLSWDIITHIDGWKIEKTTDIQDAIAKIKWPAGTKVVLTLLRSDTSLEITVQREKVTIKDVESKKIENGFYYIQMKNFWEKIETEFKAAFDDFKKSGSQKLIIDLRNNPGGYLEKVTSLLNMFVPSGENTAVIAYHDASQSYTSDNSPKTDLSQYKVYILMNGGTASASEIMIGTLKDYFPSILLIGEQTYGKGSVQTIRNYFDGSMLKYTIAKWMTGKTKQEIDGVWITPDKEVISDQTSAWDNQLNFILNNY